MTVSGRPHPTPRAPPRRVLEDASGRRLRRLRWVGRATALLFLFWIAVVILGGLGVGPARRLPLGDLLRPSSGPPPLRHVPRPVAPAPADLVPALPAPALERGAAGSAAHGRSAAAPGHTKTTAPGRSGSAPGHTATSPARGHSGSAPGKAKRTTTTAPTTTTVPGRGRRHRKTP